MEEYAVFNGAGIVVALCSFPAEAQSLHDVLGHGYCRLVEPGSFKLGDYIPARTYAPGPKRQPREPKA
jgi:hypothetical protein